MTTIYVVAGGALVFVAVVALAMRSARKRGEDKSSLDAAEAGEAAQEAEGEAFREARGGMLDRARALLLRAKGDG